MFLQCLDGDVVEIWNYLGSQGPFSGVFSHFLTPIWVKQHAGMLPERCHTIAIPFFFDVKTPKKHLQKCQICPKQVGMDSRATFGAYLCQKRFCDQKIAVFLVFS